MLRSVCLPTQTVLEAGISFSIHPQIGPSSSTQLVVSDAFAISQKAAIVTVMSVRQSAWNNSASTGRTLKIHASAFFENLSRKFKFT